MANLQDAEYQPAKNTLAIFRTTASIICLLILTFIALTTQTSQTVILGFYALTTFMIIYLTQQIRSQVKIRRTKINWTHTPTQLQQNTTREIMYLSILTIGMAALMLTTQINI